MDWLELKKRLNEDNLVALEFWNVQYESTYRCFRLYYHRISINSNVYSNEDA